MNVLITSAAAKVSLIRAFQKALAPSGGRVIAADMRADVAAFCAADGFELLPATDTPDFAPALAAACVRHDIGLMIPTRDGELHTIAAMTDLLPGVCVPLPS